MKFIDSNISCFNGVLTFSSFIDYAAQDGSRTASDLVSKMFYDFSSDKQLWINNMTSLSIASALSDDDQYADDSSSTTNTGSFIGFGFLAGFMSALFILPLLFAM